MPTLVEDTESTRLDAIVESENGVTTHRIPVIFNITPIDGARCKVIIETIEGTGPDLGDIPIDEEFYTIIGEPKTNIEDQIHDALYGLHVGDTVQMTFERNEFGETSMKDPRKIEPKPSHTDTTDISQSNKPESGSIDDDNHEPCDHGSAKMLRIKLIDFQNPPNVCDYTHVQKFEIAKYHKEAGVKFFQSGNRKFAYRRFSKSLKFLLLMIPKKKISSNIQAEYDQLRSQCYSNMAACLLKEGEYDLAVKNCTRSLEIDTTYVKSIYRRAEAYFHLKKFDECKQDISRGLKLEPNSKSFHQLLKKVKEQS